MISFVDLTSSGQLPARRSLLPNPSQISTACGRFPSTDSIASPAPPSILRPPPVSSFYPQLAFLRALHPSLVSLTPDLIAAGIDCSDSLTLLSSLESEMLNKSLKVRQARAQTTNQSLSILHLKLFKMSIEEVNGGDSQAWKKQRSRGEDNGGRELSTSREC
jgi:hypothetical protein